MSDSLSAPRSSSGDLGWPEQPMNYWQKGGIVLAVIVLLAPILLLQLTPTKDSSGQRLAHVETVAP